MSPVSYFAVGWTLLLSFALLGQTDKYLTYENNDRRPHLKDRLVLRDEQSGFAGVSGRMWVVEPDGRWRIAEIRPAGSGKTKEVTEQSGQLKPEEIVAIAKELAAHDLAGLPAKEGENPRANPHRLVLKIGEHEKVLNGIGPRRKNESTRELIAKSAPKAADASATVWTRWGDLAHCIESRIAPAKP